MAVILAGDPVAVAHIHPAKLIGPKHAAVLRAQAILFRFRNVHIACGYLPPSVLPYECFRGVRPIQIPYEVADAPGPGPVRQPAELLDIVPSQPGLIGNAVMALSNTQCIVI